MTSSQRMTEEESTGELARLRQRVSELEQLVETQKASEAKTLEAKIMFEGLFELNPDAIILVDYHGSITRMNMMAEKMFGYTHEELAGKPHESLIPEQFREIHRGQMAGYMASPRTRKMGAAGLELFGRKKDGTIFPVDISLGALGTGKELITIIAVIRTRSPV